MNDQERHLRDNNNKETEKCVRISVKIIEERKVSKKIAIKNISNLTPAVLKAKDTVVRAWGFRGSVVEEVRAVNQERQGAW